MTTVYKIVTSLAFSAAFLMAIATTPAARAQMGTSGAVMVTNGPQFNPGDRPGAWSAQQNVRDSGRYEARARQRQLPHQSHQQGVRADQRSAAAC